MRAKTLRDLINDLQKLVAENPDVGDCLVHTTHSAGGYHDHLNSFRVKTLEKYDVENEFGCFYDDEGLTIGSKVIVLSVGGN